MSISINELRCTKCSAGVCDELYVCVNDGKSKTNVYVYILFDGDKTTYGVTESSAYDYFSGRAAEMPAELEHYTRIADASQSLYARCFEYLDSYIPVLNEELGPEAGVLACIEKEKRSCVIDVSSYKKYSVEMKSRFEYDGEIYVAKVVYGSISSFDGMVFTDDITDYSICTGDDEYLEGYATLDEAAASFWLLLFCDMDRELREQFGEYLDKQLTAGDSALNKEDFRHFGPIVGKKYFGLNA